MPPDMLSAPLPALATPFPAPAREPTLADGPPLLTGNVCDFMGCVCVRA